MRIQDEAARDAERILSQTWRSGLPIDPARIATRLGLDVVEALLDENVAGALVKEQGRDPLILLNQEDSSNRKRFTCAHEIGHYVRRRDNLDNFEYVDRRDFLASLGQDPDEIYANAFAANLLMPRDEVKRLVDDGVSDFEMALRFGVSREAMHYRLSNMGLVAAA